VESDGLRVKQLYFAFKGPLAPKDCLSFAMDFAQSIGTMLTCDL
jgi:hypothetical protein